jgi:Tfp pilus assembly protein PilX
MQTKPSLTADFRSNRGSTLIVTMLLAAIVSISLVSYLKLSNNSLKQANRTFYSNSAMNLAEVGLEEAIYCFNQLDNVATATDAWPHASPVTTASPWTLNNTAYNSTSSPNTPYAVATFSGFDVGPNTTGSVKVYVHHHTALAGATPVIVAKSTITMADGSPPISKYIEVTLRKRSLFANGLVARNNVSWVGHPMADSWDSHGDTTTPATAYSSGIRTANVIVASIAGNIGLAGGEVWGYTKTGEFGVSTGGSVHPLGTSTNDPTRRTNDFNATFPNPTVPNPATTNPINASITSSRTFPAAGDVSVVVAGVTTYYYTFSASANIQLAGSDTLSITAGKNVVFLMQGKSSTTAIQVTGNAGIDVNAASSFNVYTDGNISIAGNGMANDNNYAATNMFWGTNPTSQTIDISGNGNLTAVVYAPNADVSLNGGGTSGLMNGAVVGKTITMNGGTEFHYDDALGRLTTGNPFGISKWRELQSYSERAAYATQLAY